MTTTPLLRAAFLLLALPLALAACDNYYISAGADESLPFLQLSGEGRDGKLYMLAPQAESIVEVDPTERSFDTIGVGREPTLLSRPDGSDILYTLDRKDETLSRLGADGAVAAFELGGPKTTLDWSPDGTRAIAWIDPADVADIQVEGSLNLNAYAVLNASEGNLSVEHGSLTFEPRSVTFSADSSKALIASSARVHVIDLEADPISELAVPFSTSDATHRAPNLVVPGPLAERALVTVAGVPDLFILSLEPVLIENVVALPRTAADIVWSADASKAIIADGTSGVTFLDLESFDTETLTLAHPVNRIDTSELPENSFALLYDDRGYTSYLTKVELDASGTAPDDPETYLLEEAVGRVEMAPDETAAVIFHDSGASGEWVPVQSLSLFYFEERAPSRILLDAPAWDMIFLAGGVVAGNEDPHVMVVLKDSARLVRYNLRTYAQVVLDTYPLPHAIGRVPPGEGGSELLYVIHDQDMGLVSFLPPGSETVPSGGFPAVAGMALSGLLDGR